MHPNLPHTYKFLRYVDFKHVTNLAFSQLLFHVAHAFFAKGVAHDMAKRTSHITASNA